MFCELISERCDLSLRIITIHFVNFNKILMLYGNLIFARVDLSYQIKCILVALRGYGTAPVLQLCRSRSV